MLGGGGGRSLTQVASLKHRRWGGERVVLQRRGREIAGRCRCRSTAQLPGTITAQAARRPPPDTIADRPARRPPPSLLDPPRPQPGAAAFRAAPPPGAVAARPARHPPPVASPGLLHRRRCVRKLEKEAALATKGREGRASRSGAPRHPQLPLAVDRKIGGEEEREERSRHRRCLGHATTTSLGAGAHLASSTE